MCIAKELEIVEAEMSDKDYRATQRRLQDIYMVSAEMTDCKTAEEVLPFLYAEISGNARPSFVNRIYGRYRKLLPKSDLKILNKWPRRQYEKS